MNTPEPEYQKLPGGGLSWSGRGSPWLAKDHVLEVNSMMVVERYRRFFFHEVRAFIVRRTNVRLIWLCVQGILGLVSAIAATAAFWWGYTNQSTGLNNHPNEVSVLGYVVAGIFGPIALVCLLLVIINLALGPSCRCHVLTSTGWHALAAPARLGPALQTQSRIFPRIEAAQGGPAVPQTAL